MTNGDVSIPLQDTILDEKLERKVRSRRPPRKPPAGASLNSEIQKQIGQRLKGLYDEVIKEEVPDRFLKLLRQLEVPPAKDPAGKK